MNGSSKPFCLPELENQSFQQQFYESVFEDAGTGSITLIIHRKTKTTGFIV